MIGTLLALWEGPNRWLVAAGLLLVVVVVAGIVIATLGRGSNPASFPEGSPENTIQQYLKALEIEDISLAYSLYSSELKKTCSEQRFAERFAEGVNTSDVKETRITLERTRITDSRAEVTVRMTTFRASGPFGGSERESRMTFFLSKEGEDWRFTQLSWPIYWCAPEREPQKPVPAQ